LTYIVKLDLDHTAGQPQSLATKAKLCGRPQRLGFGGGEGGGGENDLFNIRGDLFVVYKGGGGFVV